MIIPIDYFGVTPAHAAAVVAAICNAGYSLESVDAAHDVDTGHGAYYAPRVETYAHKTLTDFGRNRFRLVYWHAAAASVYVAARDRGIVRVFADDRTLYDKLPNVFPVERSAAVPTMRPESPAPKAAPIQYSLFEGV